MSRAAVHLAAWAALYGVWLVVTRGNQVLRTFERQNRS